MKKIILFFGITAIAAVVYWGCKKQQPESIVTDNATSNEIMAKVQQNEFTVEEFEIELTAQLNSTGLKKQPTDVSYNKTKEVGVVVNDLQVEMVTDSTGKISKSELQRVYNITRNEIWNAAQNEFTQGKDRVLGFMLDEKITLPPAVAGSIQNITVKLTGLIGHGVNQLPGCTFSQNYTWTWYSQFAPSTMLNELEAVLNATTPPCMPNYFSTCPEPGNTEKNLIFGTKLYQIDGNDCMPATPFICAVWGISLSCKQPCPDIYFGPSDLQLIADNARQGALYWLYKVKEISCTYNVAPAPLFSIGSFCEGFGGPDQLRNITATYRYWGCGTCKGPSIRIP